MRSPFRRWFASALAAVAVSGGIGGGAFYVFAPKAQATVNVWVSTSGNDTTCVRGNQALPCASFAKAYQIAQSGDIVSVASGTYADQTICRGGTNCSSAVADPKKTVTFQAATQHGPVVVGTLALGTNGGANPPSDLTFDGIDVHGSTVAYFDSASTQASNITFENGHDWSLADGTLSSAGLGLTNWRSVANLTISHMELGPYCCSGDLIYMDAPTSSGAVMPTNVVIEDSYMHDLYDSCTLVPAGITSTYGACSGLGFTDCQACGYDHDDGIQLWGGVNGIQILRNRWYLNSNGDVHLQGIFLECGDALGTGRAITCSNVDIENNMMWAGAQDTDNTLSMGNHYAGSDGIDGYVKLLYNTIWSDSSTTSGNADVNGLGPTTTVTVVGNAIRRWNDNNGSTCGLQLKAGGTMNPTYSHNEFEAQTCDATDHAGTPTFVSTADLAPDLHLSGAQWAIDGGEATYCPATDLDGETRPKGAACDVGADEAA